MKPLADALLLLLSGCASASAPVPELRNIRQLTRDGDDHVAYFYSACVRSDVQTYFVSGVTPPAGTTCTS